MYLKIRVPVRGPVKLSAGGTCIGIQIGLDHSIADPVEVILRLFAASRCAKLDILKVQWIFSRQNGMEYLYHEGTDQQQTYQIFLALL